MAEIVCSFCGQSAAAAGQLFENEDKTAAICSACVSMFAQNVAEAGETE
jgi:hypothetical protein